MVLFFPGEYLTIQYKNKKSGHEAKEVPHEATDRICWCTARDDNTMTVRFPYKVRHRDGTMSENLTIPRRHKLYYFERETLVRDADYERGPNKYTYMVPVEQLWESYWLAKWGKAVSESQLNGPVYKKLENAILSEGLRAPAIVHQDGTLRGGSHRVLVYKRLGHELIEAYVTATTGGTL